MTRYTVTEAAAELGLHTRHVRLMIERGQLKAEKIGHVWTITPAALEAARTRRPPGRPPNKKN